MIRKIDRLQYLLKQKKIEYNEKLEQFNTIKSQSENALEGLNTKLNEIKNKKNNLEEENEKLKVDKDKLEMDYIIKIEKMEKMKEENNKREEELNIENRELMEELIKLDRIISQKKSEIIN